MILTEVFFLDSLNFSPKWKKTPNIVKFTTYNLSIRIFKLLWGMHPNYWGGGYIPLGIGTPGLTSGGYYRIKSFFVAVPSSRYCVVFDNKQLKNLSEY